MLLLLPAQMIPGQCSVEAWTTGSGEMTAAQESRPLTVLQRGPRSYWMRYPLRSCALRIDAACWSASLTQAA